MGCEDFTITPLAADAGFRQYFRIKIGEQNYMFMDGARSHENLKAYALIADVLRAHQIRAPEIFFKDFNARFLVISDFGDNTFLKVLQADNVDAYYSRALAALGKMQKIHTIPGHSLPHFNRDFMYQEWQWHKEWFLIKFLEIPDAQKLDQYYQAIVNVIAEQPCVFTHRDYHAGNLMVLQSDLGVLDFQDAFLGPITYDLVSLLRDCYIHWPKEKVNLWVDDFYQLLLEEKPLRRISRDLFHYWFDLMGIQRHLKALMTFTRKSLRDQNHRYLAFVPRTLDYIIAASEPYPLLQGLHQFYKEIVFDNHGKTLICAE